MTRIGSDSSNMGSMDVMSAIMHDKRQYASILNSSMQLNALSSSYYDPEVSNLSVASLNYSNDAFPSSQQQHGGGEGGGHFSHLSYAGDSHLAFSPPRQGTEASSGANSHCSNRSILDNEEAAEVLSVMNSPNAYMTTRDRDRDTMEMERDREGIMGSFGSARSPAGSSTIYPPFGKSLLHSDFEGEEEGEEEGDEEDEDEEGGPAGLEARHCRLSQQAPSRRGMGLGGALVQEIEGSLLIETEPAVVAAATEQLSSRAHSYHSPPSSSYNSPVKPRRASTLDGDGGGAGAVLSPMQSLLNLAGICVEKQQQEEEQRKSQLNSPAAVLQRS